MAFIPPSWANGDGSVNSLGQNRATGTLRIAGLHGSVALAAVAVAPRSQQGPDTGLGSLASFHATCNYRYHRSNKASFETKASIRDTCGLSQGRAFLFSLPLSPCCRSLFFPSRSPLMQHVRPLRSSWSQLTLPTLAPIPRFPTASPSLVKAEHRLGLQHSSRLTDTS